MTDTPKPYLTGGTSASFTDKFWTIDWERPLSQQLTPAELTNLSLTLIQANLGQQMIYGGDDAPTILDGQDDSFDNAAWRKSHPDNQFDVFAALVQKVASDPRFVETRFPALKSAPGVKS